MKYTDRYAVVLQINLKSDDGKIVNNSFEIIPCVTYTDDYHWQPDVLEDHEELMRVNAFMRGERDTPHQ